MDINVANLREYYKILMRNATSLFQQFTLVIETQNTYITGHYCKLIQNWQTCGHDVWTAIGGLQNDANGNQDFLSNRIIQTNDDIHLLKLGNNY
jgi:hypothetical protein